MVIVAKATIQDNYIVPIPLECLPEEFKGDEPIIVAISSVPPEKDLLSSAYAFYGAENCQKIIGKIPPSEEDQIVICIQSHCLIDHAQDMTGKTPPANISPLWTEERFGVSPVEAQMLEYTSKNMMTAIHLRMRKFRKKLDSLKITTNKRSMEIIRNCEHIIETAQYELEKTKKDCRWFAAEHVAKFLRDKFKVDAWVETLVEPAVLFCISKKMTEEQAMITGCSIEGIMNEIEPDNADRLFDDYIYDASVFPIVMDVSFVEGKRVMSRKEYNQSSKGGIS